MKLKTQKGITLIALVITIIVMLILVGVSVTVSLNGGLFTTAQNAKAKTQLELEKEQLLEMALGALDNQGKVDYEKLYEIITEDGKFEMAKGTTVEQVTYTSKKTGETYVVGERGTVDKLDEITGSDAEPGELGISCVAETNGVIKVTLTYTGGEAIPTYEEYATNILKDSTQNDKEQYFIEGCVLEDPSYFKDIEKVEMSHALEYWGGETLEDILEEWEYESFDELLIDCLYVKYAEYEEKSNEIKSKRIEVSCSDGQSTKVTLTTLYTQITVEESGDYTFTAKGPLGEEAQTTVTVNLANPVEKITVLGGDVDGSGTVDGTDTMYLTRYANKWDASAYAGAIYLFDVGDLDGDNDIDETDADLLNKYTFGWAASDYAAAINLNKEFTVVKK